MEFPTRTSTTVDLEECPFLFDFPTYGSINRNKKFFNGEAPSACWFDLHLADFNADLFFSYHPLSSKKDLEQLILDTYKITNQINRRSEYMQEIKVHNQHGVGGMKFLFEGPAASPIHFYVTDTSHHFLKGALYYNSQVRPDSLMPATMFIAEDIDRLLASMQWRQ